MSKRIDPVPGERFGHWTVIGLGTPSATGLRRFKVQCVCGQVRNVYRGHLRAGKSTNCGCLQAVSNTKHGMCRHRLYPTWMTMLRRCYEPTDKDFCNYGARGISVFPAWRESIREFVDYVEGTMGARPTSKHSIDRIDNSGNYEPGNLRWSTAGEQCHNKRNNVRVEFQGERLILADWARRFGIDRRVLRHRLNGGWSMERALTTPVEKR